MSPKSPTPKATEPTRRRRGAPSGVFRGDSDDELGSDDLPWEWIYSTSEQERSEGAQGGRKRRKISGNTIIGARLGSFECHVGDCVLLKAEGSNEAWVAIICEFVDGDEDGAKAANFMWFSTEKEIRNKEKKRNDSYWVNWIPTTSNAGLES
jgi:origin recognition complex subunit 1